MAGRPAATWLDLVVGVDLHTVVVAGTPTLVPHPFMALAGDPIGASVAAASAPLISLMVGHLAEPVPGPVLVNGHRKLTTAGIARNATMLPHVPLAPGPFAQPPSGEGQFRVGALTVTGGGASCVCAGDPVTTCSDPAPLPTSSVVVIPKGRPVLVGGPVGNKPGHSSAKTASSRPRRSAFDRVPILAHFVSRLSSTRLRNIVPRNRCTLTGHPIDVATGNVVDDVVDFELPGPIPLRFTRSYSSAWANRRTDLGFGWSQSLDRAVWKEAAGVVYRAADGRELVFDARVERQDDGDASNSARATLDAITGYSLRRLGPGSWEVTTPQGLIERFERDPEVAGELRREVCPCVEIRSRDGSHQTIFIRHDGQLTGVIDAGGRRVRFTRDAVGRLTRIELPDPDDPWRFVPHLEYGYSSAGLLSEVRDALGNATHYAYSGRLMVEERRRNGVRFFWGYDGMSSAARCVRTWGVGVDGATIFNQRLLYDPANRKSWRLDSDGNRTEFRFNEIGLVTAIRDANGGVTLRRHDGFELTEEIDANGKSRRWSYDERGRLIGTVDPDGGRTIIKYHPVFHELVVTSRDQRGAVFRHRYDRAGHRTSTVGPDKTRVGYEWSRGLLVAMEIDGEGRVELDYDRSLNPIRVRFMSGALKGASLERRFDSRGQLRAEWQATTTGERVAERQFERDLLGQIVRIHEPDGNLRELAYDPQGNLAETRDRNGLERFSYRGFDWLASREESGDRVTFEYHTEGELKEIRNELGQRYSFRIDRCRRIVEEMGFDRQVIRRMKRDSTGRVTEVSLITRRGIVVERTAFHRDPAGRVVRREHSDGTWEEFSYDHLGAITAARNAAASVRFTRDKLGRVTREEQGDHWIEVSHQHSTVVGFDSSLGGHMSLLRDESGALERAFLGRTSAPSQIEIAWRHDCFGDEAERILPGGVSALWSRDPSRRPTGRFVVQESGNAPAVAGGWSQRYQWAPGNRLSALHDSRFGVTELEHDARGRVIAERSAGREQVRAFDAAGNLYRSRDRCDRRYSPGGVLRVADREEIDHDLLGNIVRRWTPGARDGWTYSWDGAGNLVQATPLHAGPAVSFTYDALGRRIGKRVGDHATTFVWLGDHLLHEIPSDGEQLVTWYPDPTAAGPLAKFVGEQRFAIVVDHLGTPASVHDETGRSVLDIQLDVYGVPRAVPPALDDGRTGASCDWRWPGQCADAETGLHYNRFRYYDPRLGLYISRDPIGLLGGLAPYAYVRDPSTWIDPLGLSACSILQVHLADPTGQRSPSRPGRFPAAPHEGTSPPPWAMTEASDVLVGQNRGSLAGPSPLVGRFSRWPGKGP